MKVAIVLATGVVVGLVIWYTWPTIQKFFNRTETIEGSVS